MERDALVQEILSSWNRHNTILLYLLDNIPEDGWTAKPAGSRGRDVARQFAHLDRVRRGWLHYHEHGERPRLPRVDKGPPPPTEAVRGWLEESGKGVGDWMAEALAGDKRPRLFGKQPIRWLNYLIAHESHHRGQILLALKQNGMKLPDKVSVEGLWGKWIYK